MASDPKFLGFNTPELIVESIIRDGIKNVQTDATIIPNVFLQLTRAYNAQKYGSAEITKIQNLVNNTPIPVVYSYFAVDSKVPCFSIMLGSDDEDRRTDHLDDYYGVQNDVITNSQELQALIKIDNVIPTAYDSISGKVSVSDLVDLSVIYFGCVYFDGQGNQFPIVGGIDNILGEKAFFIEKGSAPDTTVPGSIRSSLDYKETEIHGITMDVKMTIGVHTKDPLLTKYLYTLLKYFLLSRKSDMFLRGLYLTTYSGSDFARNDQYQGDQVYTRFLTVSGKVDDTWLDEAVEQFDSVIWDAVPKDEFEND